MLDMITIGDLTVESAQPLPKAGARPPILFVHGLFATAWVYESYLSYFAARGYAGFAVNLRGRSGSRIANNGDLGKVSLEDYVCDVRTVAQWLTNRFERPIIFGHSMGGLLAQKLAEEGLARALVLLSPAPPRGISVMSWALIRRQLRYVAKFLRSKPIVPRLSDLRELVLNRIPSGELEAAFKHFVPDSGRVARQLSFRSLAVDARRVRENDCPVLVVTGDDDRFVQSRIAQRVAERYHAPVFMTRGHGHLMLREPGWEEAAAFIADWLSRQVAG